MSGKSSDQQSTLAYLYNLLDYCFISLHQCSYQSLNSNHPQRLLLSFSLEGFQF